MSDVFLSYSRQDTDFVRRLAEGLREGGREVWVDTEGIADAEHFPDALRAAIEGADGFVFVITPAAAASQYCLQEVEHAQAMGKRIVPVLRKAAPDEDLHPEIRDRNWVPFTDDAAFDAGLERLDRALSRDLEHAKAHTRWLTRALQWEAAGRSQSLLPRGDELAAAETWLAAAGPAAEPQPTPLQRELLLKARRAATRRQRRLIAVSAVVAAVSLVLLAVAVIAEHAASHGRTVARAEALAARSDAARTVSPLAAIHLADRALATSPTRAAQRAAKAALDANPVLAAAGPFRPTESTDRCPGGKVAFRPGSGELAVLACDGTVRILDGTTGAARRTLRSAPDPVDVAYSPDGRELAVLAGRAIHVVDPATGSARATLRLPRAGALSSAAQSAAGIVRWSADGHELAARWGTRVYLAHRDGGVRIVYSGANDLGGLCFLPGRRGLVVGTIDDAVDVFDPRSGALRRTLPISDGAKYAFGTLVAPTPDGRLIVGRYTAGDDGNLEVWSTRTWRRQRIISSARFASLSSLVTTSDGSRAVFQTFSGRTTVISVRTGRTLLDLPGSSSYATVAASPDGLRLAVMSGVKPAVVRIVRAGGPERRYLEGRLERIDDVIATRTRVRAVLAPASGGMRVESWRRRDGRRLPDLVIARTGSRLDLTSENGRLLVETRPGVRDRPRVWDLDRRRIVRRLPAVRAGQITIAAHDAVVIAQGSYYNGGTHGPLLVTDFAGSPLHRTAPPGRQLCGGYQDLDMSDDHRILAAVTLCGDVLLWDARSGRRTGSLKTDADLDGIWFAKGHEVMLTRSDGQEEIWQLDPRRRRAILRSGGGGQTLVSGFSPDGRRVVTQSEDGSVRVFDAASGRLLRELRYPGIQLTADFAGNRTLLLGDDFGAVRVLDLCASCEDTGALRALTRRAARLPLSGADRALLDG